MNEIEKVLSDLTNNFTDKNAAVRCWTEDDKNKAIEVFQKYYNIVEPSDGRKDNDDAMCWVIAVESPKNNEITESILNEEDIDPEDDFDLEGFDLDSIDDSSQVANAEQLTALKKRAADLAEKWKETFKQISELGKKLDLVVSHNDELEITVEKSNGKDADIDTDLETIEVSKQMDSQDDLNTTEDDIDDSFGPSEYDNRADKLGPDVPVEESIQQDLKPIAVNEEYPWDKNSGTTDLGQSADPNELYLDPSMVDDDF